MAQKMRIKFIQEGFKEIVKAPGVASVTHEVADGIAGRANAGFTGDGEFVVVDTTKQLFGAERACSQVIGRGYAANMAEQENKVLSSAVM